MGLIAATSSCSLPRKRTLSDAEIVKIWLAVDSQGYPHGKVVQLLLLTGQLCDEELQSLKRRRRVGRGGRAHHLKKVRATASA
jgi:hypothetical protein